MHTAHEIMRFEIIYMIAPTIKVNYFLYSHLQRSFLIYATTFQMSLSDKAAFQDGIAGDFPTAAPPSLMVLNIWSLVRVDIYCASVKFLGFGLSAAPAGPFPFPSGP